MGKKSGYSGPSAYELEQQKEAYRNQWDFEAKQKEQDAMATERMEEEENAATEVRGRKGNRNTQSNAQVGFTKKPSKTDEEEDNIIGIL